jgi:hypothetical protein
MDRQQENIMTRCQISALPDFTAIALGTIQPADSAELTNNVEDHRHPPLIEVLQA